MTARSVQRQKGRTPLETLHAKAIASKPQVELLFQLQAARVPTPEPEFRFHETRRWRFDLAWPVYPVNVIYVPTRLAVEIDGGGFVGGRHGRGMGIERDCEKYAHAMLRGWRILRVTPKQVRSGEALGWIQKLLEA